MKAFIQFVVEGPRRRRLGNFGATLRAVIWLAVVCLPLLPASAQESPTQVENVEQRGNQQAGAENVQSGINERFLDPKLNVDEWLGRFEIESREVYAARGRVLAICEIEPGMRVADIGAGTGFYSRLFASAVGRDGWVYAVDISPRFLEHINQRAQKDKLENVTSVLCTDRSVCLPAHSIDVAFICDTYHHFENPESTLRSIHRALKPGGRLVVIDFERIPGVSRDFILGHVRAGKKVFRDEIVAAGFEFVEEVKVPSFKENYLLRFRKLGDEATSLPSRTPVLKE